MIFESESSSFEEEDVIVCSEFPITKPTLDVLLEPSVVGSRVDDGSANEDAVDDVDEVLEATDAAVGGELFLPPSSMPESTAELREVCESLRRRDNDSSSTFWSFSISAF